MQREQSLGYFGTDHRFTQAGERLRSLAGPAASNVMSRIPSCLPGRVYGWFAATSPHFGNEKSAMLL
jgi:hypothetical protein